MTKKLQIYKCEICGNIVEVVHKGVGELVCCGKPMKLLNENVTNAATEKHVPVVEKSDLGVTVMIGSIRHPMEEKHYIEWIEVIHDNIVLHQFLKPGDEPVAVFGGVMADSVSARAYCNLHGLWKG